MDPNLVSFGISVAANVFYDQVKQLIGRGVNTPAALREALRSSYPSLTVQNAQVLAETTVEFLAKRGDITISGSSILGKTGVVMGSAPGTQFTFGNNSVSATDSTRIEAGQGAFIQGVGGAQVRQNPDGSISFHV